MSAEIRDFIPEDSRFFAKIHDNSGFDYRFPDFTHPLFLIKKCLVVDGVPRMLVAGRLQLEAYLLMDQSDWADPEQKLIAIKELEKVTSQEAAEKGIDEVVLWVPPEMERWERRLFEDLGFSPDRKDWRSYSKKI